MGEGPVADGQHDGRRKEVEFESHEVAAEFDMGSDDGSTTSSDDSVPAKYTFYHPLPRTAQSGFVVRLDTWVYAFSRFSFLILVCIIAHGANSLADIIP